MSQSEHYMRDQWLRARAERDLHRADAERLAAALHDARGFLGIAVNSPRSAAFKADRALEAHADLAARKAQQ